jgi:hypothetical protein
MKYREYAKMNNPGITAEQIEQQVGGLFGSDAEMGEPIEYGDTFTRYNIGSYILYSNHSTFDTVERIDEDGTVLESWCLDF